jgi:DNA-binding TFAR19-related protein (PDSD5 family)
MQPAVQTATQAYNDAIKQAQGSASMAGRYGSNVSADLQNRAANTLATTLTGKAGELAYQNYANERARQEAAALQAPQLAQARYQDINQLMNVGQVREDYSQKALEDQIARYEFEQNKPYTKLQAYLGAAYGAPVGQVTKTTQSGGGKIVCTAMNAEYGFGSFRNSIWLAQSKDLDPAYEKGYHTLFLPLVNYAYKAGEKNALQRILRGVLEHIARHRTADIWKQKRGKKRDNYGMIYRAILEPICYVVGKVGK